MKYFFTTLGCKVNQFESGSISQSLKNQGWYHSKNAESADVCIINTCTVTEKASAQSRQAIRQAIRSNPDAQIIITGCYAETDPEEIKKIKGKYHLVNHKNKHKIPEIILKSTKSSIPSLPSAPKKDTGLSETFPPFTIGTMESRTRPFLKVQDGCNAFCTYCIVPYARGRSRSMPFNQALQNIKQFSDSGFKEVVLTGIHLGYYGADLAPKTDLFRLLKNIDAQNLINRLRISSIEPKELSEKIIDLVAQSATFCNHFHIPMQSGDDAILKQMSRPYTSSFFRHLVHKIHTAIPDAAIGVDTLVGFPGETQKAFDHTYALIEDLPITYLHVFPFSPRKQTPASKYPDQVEPATIKERCKQIRQLGKSKKRTFYKSAVGRIENVLIEGKKDKTTGLLKGLTSNYIPVLINGGDELINKIIKVRIMKINQNDSVSGELE